jgi:peptidoglycan/xylan/chitin deacetylase (PgdA/CDA1 family)
VALTFDDGPHAEHTPAVLSALRAHSAPATFFVNGERVRTARERELLEEIATDPLFELGNHTWSHSKLTELSREEAVAEVDRTTELLADFGDSARWLRFPFGASNCETAGTVIERGYTIVGWHVDSADWCFAVGNGQCSPETLRHISDVWRVDMVGHVLNQIERRDGGIVLLHDSLGFTAELLDRLLVRLEQSGAEFVPLGALDAFPVLNGERPPAFVGSPCAEAADCAFAPGGYCHIEGFCTLPCAGFCPDAPGRPGTFCVPDSVTGGATGSCVPRAEPANAYCEDVPGTVRAMAERFVGRSDAPPAAAEVCLPATD